MFKHRHIENREAEIQAMLNSIGVSSLDDLINKAIPPGLRTDSTDDTCLPPPMEEEEVLAEMQKRGQQNHLLTSMIGQGYCKSFMPTAIQRNIFENPGWYSAYTAYQSEAAQGRLEALFNFQTLSSSLTGLPVANASLLDEATAVAEAAQLALRYHRDQRNSIVVLEGMHPQSLAVLRTRMKALEISIEIHKATALPDMSNAAALLLQIPTTLGAVYQLEEITAHARKQGALVVLAIDPMFLVLSNSPANWGVDIAVGSFQRFGLPLGYGGPHAAFFAVAEKYKRLVPGRIVGESRDTNGRVAYRLALQTREQHIRREKATSNICTSQVLLAVLSSMYAVYHGPMGLKNIALRIFSYARRLSIQLQRAGTDLHANMHFDTVSWNAGNQAQKLSDAFSEGGYSIRKTADNQICITFDEATREQDFEKISQMLSLPIHPPLSIEDAEKELKALYAPGIVRTEALLPQELFQRYHTETELMRYLRMLMDKDLALDRAMIPLGSCTMKLNAATELLPLSWNCFANMHPFAPLNQAKGYLTLIRELETYLCEITGYDSISLQPNAGSQGEYAGLLAVTAYHRSRGEGHRDICLIPSSAHGTNPASAKMANLEVIIVACDGKGNIDFEDLSSKVAEYSERLAVLMITYPSTHGVYESNVKEICALIHQHGGQVYIDGANLNALVGLVKIAELGGDLSHLNLHKTFAIPHGGGGPGVGPLGVKKHLAPFLPQNILLSDSAEQEQAVGPVSAAPWGSALILLISWVYIRMMGFDGLREASIRAVLHANYIARRLKEHYPVLYTGENGMVAHECIIDLRQFQEHGIEVEDIAKRLIDYGFHAPTMSWPVMGTLMIEPTESESKRELDRFCNAMISIRAEIGNIVTGKWPGNDNPLVHAPHVAEDLCADNWNHVYTRQEAAYPFASNTSVNHPWQNNYKYWPPVSRVDNVYGDKNLICSCPSP